MSLSTDYMKLVRQLLGQVTGDGRIVLNLQEGQYRVELYEAGKPEPTVASVLPRRAKPATPAQQVMPFAAPATPSPAAPAAAPEVPPIAPGPRELRAGDAVWEPGREEPWTVRELVDDVVALASGEGAARVGRRVPRTAVYLSNEGLWVCEPPRCVLFSITVDEGGDRDDPTRWSERRGLRWVCGGLLLWHIEGGAPRVDQHRMVCVIERENAPELRGLCEEEGLAVDARPIDYPGGSLVRAGVTVLGGPGAAVAEWRVEAVAREGQRVELVAPDGTARRVVEHNWLDTTHDGTGRFRIVPPPPPPKERRKLPVVDRDTKPEKVPGAAGAKGERTLADVEREELEAIRRGDRKASARLHNERRLLGSDGPPDYPVRTFVLLDEFSGATRGLTAFDPVRSPGASGAVGGDLRPFAVVETPVLESPDIAALLERLTMAGRPYLDLGVSTYASGRKLLRTARELRERWNEANPAHAVDAEDCGRGLFRFGLPATKLRRLSHGATSELAGLVEHWTWADLEGTGEPQCWTVDPLSDDGRLVGEVLAWIGDHKVNLLRRENSSADRAALAGKPRMRLNEAAASAPAPGASKPSKGAKLNRQQKVAEADGLAVRGQHTILGFVDDEWTTLAIRKPKTTNVAWALMAFEASQRGVRVRLYDGRPACTWDSLDGGKP